MCYNSRFDYDFIHYPWEFSAPTFSQAFRWFREKYELRGQIISDYDMFSYQIYGLIDNAFNLINGGSVDREYEEAELECLKKLIEIVKSK